VPNPIIHKRKLAPDYWSSPQRIYKKSAPQFIPGLFGYQYFEQYNEPTDAVNARIVRQLWNSACDGGDCDAAIEVIFNRVLIA
jgi:hypothetical protein